MDRQGVRRQWTEDERFIATTTLPLPPSSEFMMESSAFESLKCSGLPIIAMGVLILIVCVVFCCYLQYLKRQGRQLLGFRHVTYTFLHRPKSERCPVCLEEFCIHHRVAQTKCKHLFHRKCLRRWLEMKQSCPLCATQLSPLQDTDEETSLV